MAMMLLVDFCASFMVGVMDRFSPSVKKLVPVIMYTTSICVKEIWLFSIIRKPHAKMVTWNTQGRNWEKPCPSEARQVRRSTRAFAALRCFCKRSSSTGSRL